MPTRSEPASKPVAGPATSPPPARVPGNMWTAIDVAEIGGLAVRERVSVVVSGPDPDGSLALTLAALAHQTYPAALLDVVVETPDGVDEAELRRTAPDLELTFVRTGGTGEAAAGIEAARGPILVLLAAGSLPERELVEAHARWHHAVADAVSAGVGRAIDARGLDVAEVAEAQAGGGLEPLLAGRLATAQPGAAGIDALVERTRRLTERRPDLFRVAARGSLGLRAETWRAAGGAGAQEDARLARLDLAYRLDCLGCVFVPERAAVAYESRAASAAGEAEPAGSPEVAAGGREDAVGDGVPAAGGEAEAAVYDPRAASMLPVPGFRPRGSGRVFARPALAVDVPVGEGDGAAQVLETVDAVLRGRLSDLVVRVQVPGGHAERGLIEEACAADPRVVVGPPSTEARSEAPYQATLPPSMIPDESALDAIHELMSEQSPGALRVTVTSHPRRVPVALPSWAGRLLPHATVEVVASGALARSRRIAAAGGADAADVLRELFGERHVAGSELGIRSRGAPEHDATEDRALGPATDLAHERAEHLRFRARAATNQARLDRQAQGLFRERLRASHERTRAERLEARLARVSPPYWVGWKARRVARRVVALPKRLWQRVTRVREPLYRLRLRATAAVARRRG